MTHMNYTIDQYNEVLADLEPALNIQFSGIDFFGIYDKNNNLISEGDYDEISKRAYGIIKEDGLLYELNDL